MDNLYNDIITDHSEYPEHEGEINDADFSCELTNASCGDKIKISLKFDGKKIIDIKFSGESCAISTASADLMADVFIGKTKNELHAIKSEFLKMLRGEEFSLPEDLTALQRISKMPARIKCAELAWQIIEKI